MNSCAAIASRPPTIQEAIKFVSASRAVQVHTLTESELALLVGWQIFVLRPNEAPDFVALNPLAGQVAKRLVLIDRTSRANFQQEFGDGILGNAHHPSDCANARALD